MVKLPLRAFTSLLMIYAASAEFHPKVCQKVMGVRSARLPDPRVCQSTATHVIPVQVEVLAEDYSEKSTEGRVVRKMRNTCDIYENMLTVTRSRRVEVTEKIDVSEYHMIGQGLCPYKEEPLPYYLRLEAECRESYLSETSTTVRYCLAVVAHVTRMHGDKMRCDRVDTNSCKYSDGMCPLEDGGLLVWPVDIQQRDRVTVWKGAAEYYDRILVIPSLQEAYNLKQDIQLGEMETQEGLTIKVTQMSPQQPTLAGIRRKRSDNPIVGQALDAMHKEMNSKLQYVTATVLAPLKDTVENLCTGLGVHAGVLYSLVDKSPDEYIRWILGDAYLTATIMDDVVLYWPCRKVELWHIRPNLTICYAELPVQFHNGEEWMEGYMDTRTGDISLTSTPVTCNTSVHWYRQGSMYYKMQGNQVYPITLTTTHNLPLRVNTTILKSILIPRWENTWIYNSSMFIQQDRISSATGVLADRYSTLLSYVEHSTPDSQIRYIADQMGVGAWGMAPYGVIFTIYKMACQIGGALFFVKIFVAPWFARLFVEPPTVKPEEEEGERVTPTDRERYEMMRRARPLHKKAWDRIRGV